LLLGAEHLTLAQVQKVHATLQHKFSVCSQVHGEAAQKVREHHARLKEQQQHLGGLQKELGITHHEAAQLRLMLQTIKAAEDKLTHNIQALTSTFTQNKTLLAEKQGALTQQETLLKEAKQALNRFHEVRWSTMP
jgi:DNA repair exonuclease SbcCD ATPase subunit